MRRLRVFLDANVLVDAQVRDLFLSAADAELIDIRWSAEVLDETRRALVDRLGLPPAKVASLVRAMTEAFPGVVVEDYKNLIQHLDLPDPDDRHVLAAAERGDCDVLVTFNVTDFPVEGVTGRLQVLGVDQAIVLLVVMFDRAMVQVVRDQAKRLGRPRLALDDFLDRLAQRAPAGAAALRSIPRSGDND